MKNQLSLTLLVCMLTLAFSAHATTGTDAGTILRDVATQPTVAPATITPLTAQTGDISTDNTPINVSEVVLVGNTLLTTA